MHYIADMRLRVRVSLLSVLVLCLVMVAVAHYRGITLHEFFGRASTDIAGSGTGQTQSDNPKKAVSERVVLEDVGKDIDDQMLQGEEKAIPDDDMDFLGTGSVSGEVLNEEDFKKIYQEAIATDDTYTKVRVAQALYAQYGTPETLSVLVELLVSLREFDKALDYIQEAEKQEEIVEVFGANRIIYLMFNSLELHFKNFNRLKSTITTYLSNDDITDVEYDFYFALISLGKGDLNNYSYYVDRLKGTVYNDRYVRLENRRKESGQYGDVPEYYLLGLLGIDAYVEGRYQIAQLVAVKVVQADTKYLLGHQLLAYSDIMIGRREEAAEELRYLQANETDHVQLYLLLEAISLFELKKYADAIYLLRQIKDPLLLSDAKRYLLLSYDALEDRANTFVLIQEMIQRPSLIVHDYFTIFDTQLYTRSEAVPELTNEEIADLTALLARCYADLQNDHAYVCLYGKAGILHAEGDTKKAKGYLERLVRRYPRTIVFERLGDMSAAEKDFAGAKKRYFNALRVSSQDSELYNEMRSKVMSTVMNGR